MAFDGQAYLLSGFEIPEPNGFVITRGYESFIIGAKGDVVNEVIMTEEGFSDELQGLAIPDFDGVVILGGDEPGAIGGIEDTVDTRLDVDWV